ncbi:prepilin peptidase [Fusobacterium necrophorum]|uniref:prepilin peptidase n=1 Tax=Fusobacterium necrophorum TaxID=859 RepID=UPI00209C485D|nr:prepilin peptidase [Fusobacterium necrophorum]
MEKLLICCLVILMLFLSIEDIQTKEISNFGNLLLLFCSILYSKLLGNSIGNILISMSTYICPLIFLYGYLSDFLKKEILGFGDIKFVMAIGTLMTSYNLWLSMYYFYMISFLLASMVGICLLYRKRVGNVTLF